MDLTYKHIEITSRPNQTTRVEGKVTYFFDNNMYSFSYVCASEAECLIKLNAAVKETRRQLEEFQ